jgi:hypothetical protein
LRPSSHGWRMTVSRADAQPSVSFASTPGSPSGSKWPWNRPMNDGTVPSASHMITLRRERAQAVPNDLSEARWALIRQMLTACRRPDSSADQLDSRPRSIYGTSSTPYST